jgi:hypothetical protein
MSFAVGRESSQCPELLSETVEAWPVQRVARALWAVRVVRVGRDSLSGRAGAIGLDFAAEEGDDLLDVADQEEVIVGVHPKVERPRRVPAHACASSCVILGSASPVSTLIEQLTVTSGAQR